MPESVRDRCTKAHEYVFLLTKSDRYFFDAEAISDVAVTAGKVNLGFSPERAESMGRSASGNERTGGAILLGAKPVTAVPFGQSARIPTVAHTLRPTRLALSSRASSPERRPPVAARPAAHSGGESRRKTESRPDPAKAARSMAARRSKSATATRNGTLRRRSQRDGRRRANVPHTSQFPARSLIRFLGAARRRRWLSTWGVGGSDAS